MVVYGNLIRENKSIIFEHAISFSYVLIARVLPRARYSM